MSAGNIVSYDPFKTEIGILSDQYPENRRVRIPRPFWISNPTPDLRKFFFGSRDAITVTSDHKISFDPPACLATPNLFITAIEAIELGLGERTDSPYPVRLYTPLTLTLTSNKIFIGDLEFISTPNAGFVFCKELTFTATAKEEVIEVVRSYVKDDATVVNTSNT